MKYFHVADILASTANATLREVKEGISRLQFCLGET